MGNANPVYCVLLHWDSVIVCVALLGNDSCRPSRPMEPTKVQVA